MQRDLLMLVYFSQVFCQQKLPYLDLVCSPLEVAYQLSGHALVHQSELWGSMHSYLREMQYWYLVLPL